MLTKQSYFTDKNNYLTCSKLKSFVLDPYYFYKLYISREISVEQSPSMRIGSAVDCLLTGYKGQFDRKYEVVERRNLKEPPKKTQLTPAENAKVQAIFSAVASTSVYKDLKKNYKAQEILSFDFDPDLINPYKFEGFAGIPDWYKISEDGKIATIVDLKTTADINPRRFSYTAADMGYYFQQACYQMLLENKFSSIVEYESFILAVENDATLNRVRIFELNQQEIELEKIRVKELITKVINFDYKPTDTTWDDVIEL